MILRGGILLHFLRDAETRGEIKENVHGRRGKMSDYEIEQSQSRLEIQLCAVLKWKHGIRPRS